jgi:hypothetical protein
MGRDRLVRLGEHYRSMKDLLEKIFDRAEHNKNLLLHKGEVVQLKEFILQLTAQNTELAMRLNEDKRPRVKEQWSPFDVS